MHRFTLAPVALAVAAALAGCGSGHNAATTTTHAAPAATTATTATSGPGALQAEANAASAGDIPDNQVFLVFRNGAAGYAIKYPEGWAQHGSGNAVVFRDKNNIARIEVSGGGAPTAATVRQELRHLRGTRLVAAPQSITLPGGHALKVVYSTDSAPNAVTGKRLTLVVDRYYLARSHRRAVVDLGTPQGVDNVDAYRLMIQSFRWR